MAATRASTNEQMEEDEQPIEVMHLETRGTEERDGEEQTRRMVLLRLERLLGIDGTARASATTDDSEVCDGMEATLIYYRDEVHATNMHKLLGRDTASAAAAEARGAKVQAVGARAARWLLEVKEEGKEARAVQAWVYPSGEGEQTLGNTAATQQFTTAAAATAAELRTMAEAASREQEVKMAGMPRTKPQKIMLRKNGVVPPPGEARERLLAAQREGLAQALLAMTGQEWSGDSTKLITTSDDEPDSVEVCETQVARVKRACAHGATHGVCAHTRVERERRVWARARVRVARGDGARTRAERTRCGGRGAWVARGKGVHTQVARGQRACVGMCVVGGGQARAGVMGARHAWTCARGCVC